MISKAPYFKSIKNNCQVFGVMEAIDNNYLSRLILILFLKIIITNKLEFSFMILYMVLQITEQKLAQFFGGDVVQILRGVLKRYSPDGCDISVFPLLLPRGWEP